jgi:hypothetical protein
MKFLSVAIALLALCASVNADILKEVRFCLSFFEFGDEGVA